MNKKRIKEFIIKYKIGILLSVIVLITIFSMLIWKFGFLGTNNNITTPSNSAESHGDSASSSSNPMLKTSPNIYNIKVASNDDEQQMKNEIKTFIKDNVILKYIAQLQQDNIILADPNKPIFSFAYLDFPAYNPIDKTITSTTSLPNHTKILIQPGMFSSPIKDAPQNLLAVYFDGGSKRGGDEEDNEEGDAIPKYTLDSLKQMSNGAQNIYIFWKANVISNIYVNSFEEMNQYIKQNINPDIEERATSSEECNHTPCYNACKNSYPDWEINNPPSNLLGVYVEGDNQALTSETPTLEDLKSKINYEHKIHIFYNTALPQ
ncbi:hypothetical protein [Candidatus Phytoplasma meliae]|uniref:Uncharacterized protein n=1 Tax=Candidatus Phytoplasma meliae TaxID=1848402 RepID=A0ABS5CYN1_9MOLU|nr:hypothetical protein [Candidatus Phytoplasma meliae]MBP5836083.1 hypothetical protein [Candidatus Phytoplasma meliae]